jgi:hypothetical protein
VHRGVRETGSVMPAASVLAAANAVCGMKRDFLDAVHVDQSHVKQASLRVQSGVHYTRTTCTFTHTSCTGATAGERQFYRRLLHKTENELDLCVVRCVD